MISIPTSGIVVDASCRTNRGSKDNDGYYHGRTEWRVVDIASREVVVNSKVYGQGTANIGEFGAIVDALYLLHMRGDKKSAVYSDSKIALSWFRNRSAKTRLPLNDETRLLLDTLKGMEEWIRETKIYNDVFFWNNRLTENYADFGRK